MATLTRRGFFGLLGATAAIAVTPEPIKKYFFAPQGGWTRGEDGLYSLRAWQQPASSGLLVKNPNAFYDSQTIEWFDPQGGLKKGTAVIEAVDPMTNTIWFASPVSAKVGDIILSRPHGGFPLRNDRDDRFMHGSGTGVLDYVVGLERS